MSDRMNENLLEARLVDLGDRIAYPVVPALAPAVVARLEGDPRRPLFPTASWSRARFVLAAFAFIAVVSGGLLLASPATREAVADWLGIDGIRITFDDDREARVPVETPIDTRLDLGRAVSVQEAEEYTGFTVATPSIVGEPDAIYLNDEVPGGEVSLIYEPRPELPEVGSSGVGLLITQFSDFGDTDAYLKKLAQVGTEVRSVTVSGHQGFWISGAPHLLVSEFSSPARLAGNTLIWATPETTYRVEADVSLSRALEIAESLR